jgi:hypothetical protein
MKNKQRKWVKTTFDSDVDGVRGRQPVLSGFKAMRPLMNHQRLRALGGDMTNDLPEVRKKINNFF